MLYKSKTVHELMMLVFGSLVRRGGQGSHNIVRISSSMKVAVTQRP
jgi:hypothetical protein